jgi:hypothetical protein
MVTFYLLGPGEEIFTVLRIEFALKISHWLKGEQAKVH